MNYVAFNHVFKTYPRSTKAVINDFNLSISKGEFIVIVGPSGSGKSTLLELICGFEKMTLEKTTLDPQEALKLCDELMKHYQKIEMLQWSFKTMPCSPILALTKISNLG